MVQGKRGTRNQSWVKEDGTIRSLPVNKSLSAESKLRILENFRQAHRLTKVSKVDFCDEIGLSKSVFYRMFAEEEELKTRDPNSRRKGGNFRNEKYKKFDLAVLLQLQPLVSSPEKRVTPGVGFPSSSGTELGSSSSAWPKPKK